MASISYYKFLAALKTHFDVRRLQDYEKKSRKSICLLRHDVDSSLTKALRMSEIESTLGIRSTYFMFPSAAYYQEDDFKGGCPFGNFAQELGDINENFRIKTESIFYKVVEKFSSFLSEAKKQSEVDENIDEFVVANSILNYWQGTLQRLKVSKETQHYEKFLKQIFEVILKKI